VIGAYVADCFVAAPRFPRWGEEYEARSIRTAPGGKALNQAVALARLGAHVSAIGVVGKDGLGCDIMSALIREGIETEFFVTCEKAATSICICFVGDNGQTSFVWHIDEGGAVTPEIVRAAEPALRRADAVLVTFEAPVPTIREVLKLANRCDAQVFVQPAPPLSNRSAAAAHYPGETSMFSFPTRQKPGRYSKVLELSGKLCKRPTSPMRWPHVSVA